MASKTTRHDVAGPKDALCKSSLLVLPEFRARVLLLQIFGASAGSTTLANNAAGSDAVSASRLI